MSASGRTRTRLAIAGLVGVALASAGAAEDARFDPRHAAAPYFAEGPAHAATVALAQKDYAGCARVLGPLVGKSHGVPKDRVQQAQLLLAYCEWKAGDLVAAGDHFDALVAKYPLLSDYARFFAAEARLAQADYPRALEQARAVSARSPLAAEAQVVIATALDRDGHPREAADAYARYLAAYPRSWRVDDLRGRLAAALDAAGRSAEAAAVWREVYIETPISQGARAEPHLDPQKPLGADELARRAMALFDAMKNKDSELAWGKVPTAPGVTPALICRARYHLAQSVWKQRDRARSASLFEESATACEAAKDEDLTAKSLYQAGRAHGSRAEKGKPEGEREGERALVLYAKLMSEYAAHSHADDAALRRADVLDTLGRSDDATAELATIPQRFPSGDMRGAALFRLAFRAFEKADYATAKIWLDKELQLLPREEGWWQAGRTLYWLARCRELLGDPAGAQDAYERTIREYPLSYYALLANNRLQILAPKAAAALLDEVAWNAPPPSLTVADRPLFHSDAFLRAIELMRLGLGAEARRELAEAGIEAAKKGVAPTSDPELGWVAAELHEAAGDFIASHAYGRYVDLAFMRRWPVGADELYWRLSFPRAYGALVEENVKKTGQPAALEMAIMREESAFDPNLESFANAVGLVQLTQPPAIRFAEGLPHDPQSLRDPAINLAIGARELGQLYAAFDKNAALAIAGYNAGEGAVKRWLKDPDNQGRALDEFVERIPYDETRGYTERVLGTYFTYAWLDRSVTTPAARVPHIDFALPRAKRK